MSTARTLSPPGKTRVCPHCKSVILDSANICPACRHHLRFGQKAEQGAVQKQAAFHVEGIIRPPAGMQHSEYSVVVSIRDEHGQEIKRQVVDVGVMEADDQRTFGLSVEVSPARRY